MIIAVLIPFFVFAVWLFAEIKDRSKGFRITLGVLTFICIANALFALSFVWGYDKYHYRVSLSKIRSSLDAGELRGITNALQVYEQAAIKESFGSFAASAELNRALGHRFGRGVRPKTNN
jgi:hypothetical protein